MASTNKTTHYELPQWIGTDKPTFLGDMNQAYEDIDTAIYNAATAASNAASAAGSAQSAAATAQSAAESAGSTASAANTLATTANTNAVAALNAIGSASLETVAQTINAAVNEVLGKLKANGQTAQVTYDSTSQKYGVTIDQVFYPFEDSADFQAELYDALQYSGLVEEGDTVDEMLAALAAYFPQIVNIIPVLTSNTGSNGVASASAEYSGAEAYLAMDGNDTTSWTPLAGSVDSTGTGWLKYTFTNPVTANRVVIGGVSTLSNYQSAIPTTFTVSYIDTSDVEHTLATKSADAAEVAAGFNIDFTRTAGIKAIKIALSNRNIVETNTFYYIELATFQLENVG